MLCYKCIINASDKNEMKYFSTFTKYKHLKIGDSYKFSYWSNHPRTDFRGKIYEICENEILYSRYVEFLMGRK